VCNIITSIQILTIFLFNFIIIIDFLAFLQNGLISLIMHMNRQKILITKIGNLYQSNTLSTFNFLGE